jgi:hypothetical protein
VTFPYAVVTHFKGHVTTNLCKRCALGRWQDTGSRSRCSLQAGCFDSCCTAVHTFELAALLSSLNALAAACLCRTAMGALDTTLELNTISNTPRCIEFLCCIQLKHTTALSFLTLYWCTCRWCTAVRVHTLHVSPFQINHTDTQLHKRQARW